MMAVKTVDIKDLRSDPKNARKHGDRNKKAIKASLEMFGAGRSLVLDKDGVIRAGNGTVEQAREAGFERVMVVEPDAKTLVAVQRSDWTTEQAAAYALADNRSGELAEWDAGVLDEVIQSLPGVDLESLGWSREEIESITSVFNVDAESDMPKLEGGEPEFVQITFTFTADQVDIVKTALAKAIGEIGDKGKKTGPALAKICEAYL